MTGCISVKEVRLPKNLKKLGSGLCYRCLNLDKIIYPGTKKQWAAVQKNSDWASGLPSQTKFYCSDGEVSLN